jgi:hypothetical protein
MHSEIHHIFQYRGLSDSLNSFLLLAVLDILLDIESDPENESRNREKRILGARL